MPFAGHRHRLIVNNIANFSTPGYRAMDVSVDAFQAQLGEAVDARRKDHGASGGELELRDSRMIKYDSVGITLHPEPIGQNILFHDRNDRDLERTMQDLAENFMTFRVAADLLRSRMALLNTAIRERI